jgi:hypothetical protein
VSSAKLKTVKKFRASAVAMANPFGETIFNFFPFDLDKGVCDGFAFSVAIAKTDWQFFRR